MNIFLTGARGYIGSAVARELVRAGHEVAGLTHSPDKAGELTAAGVEPVVGDLKKPDSFRKRADACEVLIHAAVEYGSEGTAADRSALDALIASARSAKGPRTLVYTSGVWVLGNHAGSPLEESAPVHPSPIVAWRPAHEQLALGAADGNISAVVLRPGCVYGGAGSLYGTMLRSAAEKRSVRLAGDGNNCWAAVYLEDLARLYRLAVEKRPKKEIYHGTDGSAEPLRDVATALAAAVGGAAVETWPIDDARKALGPFADALALDQRVSSRKAERELGWRPTWNSVVKNAPALAAQWRGTIIPSS